MRQLYRGLLELRALKLVARGSEACWVAPAIDLKAPDVVLGGARAAGYMRALGSRTGNATPRHSEARRLLASSHKPFAGTAYEALVAAIGAAGVVAHQPEPAVAVAFVPAGLKAREWARALQLAAAQEVPLVVVALPGAPPDTLGGPDAKTGVPVIPVDAGDVVAIYRVAQECIVRARADRRPAVIACVAAGTEPVKAMAAQLAAKGIASATWLAKAGQESRSLVQKIAGTPNNSSGRSARSDNAANASR